MPHDLLGQVLQVGDKVIVPARVTMVHIGDDYCNCTIELEKTMPPDNTKNTFSINTKQVIKYDQNLFFDFSK